MVIDFTDKIVIVTGGTRGIGAAIAQAFRENDAQVIATGTDQKFIEQLNSASKTPNLIYQHLDFTSRNSVDGFLSYIRELGKIHVLVNCAGVNKIDLIEEIAEEDWDWINAINLKGPFLLTRSVARLMKNAGYGRIVNIASIFGVVSKSKRAAYSTTKWGLVGFTKAIALDLASENVLVNAVSPGFVDTELTRKILGEDELNALIETIPMQRMAQAKEIAQTVLFLSSDSNTYITGQNIVVDGGYTSA